MWLAIDTATDHASVALGVRGDVALEENLTGARRHAGQLLTMIETLLWRARITLDDLTGIALSDGPGSFTGLRVGATVAKALGHTRGLPLWTAPSLLVRAASATSMVLEGATVVAATNALRGEVFAAAYRFTPAAIVTESPPKVWRPDVLVRGGLQPALIVGELPPDTRAVLEAWVHRPMVVPPEGAPHAAQLIDLVGRVGGAVRVDDVSRWEPIYGRPAEAQVLWETTHGRPLPNSASSPR